MLEGRHEGEGGAGQQIWNTGLPILVQPPRIPEVRGLVARQRKMLHLQQDGAGTFLQGRRMRHAQDLPRKPRVL